jgi:hypothetical protein
MINESREEERKIEENKMSELEKQEMQARREDWINRVLSNRMINVKRCIGGNEQAKKLQGK